MIARYIYKSKAYIVCFALILISVYSYEQKNLVPNYSFEDSFQCPTIINHSYAPYPWYITCKNNYTAVYLNACANGYPSNYGVPFNFGKGSWNYQPARTGQAYVLTDYLFYEQPILQAPLLDSLKPNKKYYCEFFVNQINSMKLSCNNHGMLFTKTAVYPDTVNYTCGVLQANPQILLYGNPIISDTVNWVKVSGIYKAQGGEKYISIGNFFTWQNTKYITTNATGTGNGASYLIDDVSVIPLDSFNLKADAGRDTTIHIGDSAFIGSYTNGIDSIKWQVLNMNGTIDSIRPGFWVHPIVNTCYVITQTVNGYTSSDTVCVSVLPLPLKMINYELLMINEHTPNPSQEGNVENRWQTANEINVSHFYVQRSTNGKDFNIIHKEPAKNQTVNNYSFIDETPNEGVNYYRIVSVDRDGKISFSEVRQLTIRNEQLAISIYPNPAKDVVNIECKDGIKEVRIINCLGRVVYKQIATGTNLRNDATSINIKNLNKGLYVVQVITKAGEVKSEKLVIE